MTRARHVTKSLARMGLCVWGRVSGLKIGNQGELEYNMQMNLRKKPKQCMRFVCMRNSDNYTCS